MVNPQTNDGETMLNPQCCRLTPKFSPFPRKFNYCAIFLVVNSQKLPKNLHFMIHLIPLLLLPRLPPILLPSLPHRRRPPPPVSAPPRAARPLADPPSRPCDPRRSRRRRRHRCCWGGECRPSYPGNCGFWERTEGFHQETWGFTSPISWDVSNDHEDSAINISPMAMWILSSKVRTSPRLIQQQ